MCSTRDIWKFFFLTQCYNCPSKSLLIFFKHFQRFKVGQCNAGLRRSHQDRWLWNVQGEHERGEDDADLLRNTWLYCPRGMVTRNYCICLPSWSNLFPDSLFSICSIGLIFSLAWVRITVNSRDRQKTPPGLTCYQGSFFPLFTCAEKRTSDRRFLQDRHLMSVIVVVCSSGVWWKWPNLFGCELSLVAYTAILF